MHGTANIVTPVTKSSKFTYTRSIITFRIFIVLKNSFLLIKDHINGYLSQKVGAQIFFHCRNKYILLIHGTANIVTSITKSSKFTYTRSIITFRIFIVLRSSFLLSKDHINGNLI